MSTTVMSSSYEAMEALKKRTNDKSMGQAISFLTSHISKPVGIDEFNAAKSKQLLDIVADVLMWYDQMNPITAAKRDELARLLRLLQLLPLAFDHLPAKFPDRFFARRFEKYTSTAERSTVKFALVGLFVKVRQTANTPKSALAEWISEQLWETPQNKSANLAFHLIAACEDVLFTGTSPAAQNPDVFMECLSAVYYLAMDLFPSVAAAAAEGTTAKPFPGMLFANFAFFPFATRIVALVERPSSLSTQMFHHLNAVFMVWRRLRLVDDKRLADEEEEFVRKLNPKLSMISVEEIQFLANWSHNSRRTAKLLVRHNLHILAIAVLRDENYDNAPLLEACLALLVNLARKQVATHQQLVDAGVTEVVQEMIKDKHNNANIVSQCLAFVLNMSSTNSGRMTFLDLPPQVVFHTMPNYSKNNKVLEMSLGVLWGLVVRYPADPSTAVAASSSPNMDFLDQWLVQVFSTVTSNAKDFDILRRGLGAMILMLTVNKELMSKRFKAKYPKYMQSLKELQKGLDKANVLNSDIDMLLQLAA